MIDNSSLIDDNCEEELIDDGDFNTSGKIAFSFDRFSQGKR
jgi:hypothetical protein